MRSGKFTDFEKEKRKKKGSRIDTETEVSFYFSEIVHFT